MTEPDHVQWISQDRIFSLLNHRGGQREQVLEEVVNTSKLKLTGSWPEMSGKLNNKYSDLSKFNKSIYWRHACSEISAIPGPSRFEWKVWFNLPWKLYWKLKISKIFRSEMRYKRVLGNSIFAIRLVFYNLLASCLRVGSSLLRLILICLFCNF